MLPVRLGFVYKIFTLRTKADGSHFAKGSGDVHPEPRIRSQEWQKALIVAN
jgi:hypothetical protein